MLSIDAGGIVCCVTAPGCLSLFSPITILLALIACRSVETVSYVDSEFNLSAQLNLKIRMKNKIVAVNRLKCNFRFGYIHLLLLGKNVLPHWINQTKYNEVESLKKFIYKKTKTFRTKVKRPNHQQENQEVKSREQKSKYKVNKANIKYGQRKESIV